MSFEDTSQRTRFLSGYSHRICQLGYSNKIQCSMMDPISSRLFALFAALSCCFQLDAPTKTGLGPQPKQEPTTGSGRAPGEPTREEGELARRQAAMEAGESLYIRNEPIGKAEVYEKLKLFEPYFWDPEFQAKFKLPAKLAKLSSYHEPKDLASSYKAIMRGLNELVAETEGKYQAVHEYLSGEQIQIALWLSLEKSNSGRLARTRLQVDTGSGRRRSFSVSAASRPEAARLKLNTSPRQAPGGAAPAGFATAGL